MTVVMEAGDDDVVAGFFLFFYFGRSRAGALEL